MSLTTHPLSIFEADVVCHLHNSLTLDMGIGKPTFVMGVGIVIRSQGP